MLINLAIYQYFGILDYLFLFVLMGLIYIMFKVINYLFHLWKLDEAGIFINLYNFINEKEKELKEANEKE